MRGKVPGAFRTGNYEPKVSQIFMRTIKIDWTCVDVGAHLGFFSLLMARIVGKGGQVIAFEAHPENAQRVQSNIKINGYNAWTHIENMAVSDHSCKSVKLFPGRGHSAAEWNIVGHDVGLNSTVSELEVPATSLDDYFAHGKRVDFVKLDIEGAEGLAIHGMQRLLQEGSPIVFIEFHDDNGSSSRDVLIDQEYRFYDVEKEQFLDGEQNLQRVYHCLAIPGERYGEVGL